MIHAGARAFILLGAPGSGKGTQAILLKACLGVPHLSTGELLRERLREGGPGVEKIAAIVNSGGLVADEFVNAMVDERLGAPDARCGIILDGYPRTLEQARHLSARLAGLGMREVVIHLLVDYNVIIARLTGRRECPCCGAVYHVTSHRPKQPGICDLDGCALVARQDDSEPVIRERLAAYDKLTRPLLGFFRDKGRLLEFDGSHLASEALGEEICKAVKE